MLQRLLGSKFRADALTYSISIGVARALGFVLLPLYAALMPTAEMGRLVTAGIAVLMVQILTGLGMPQALLRFFPQAEPADRRALLSGALITSAASAAAFAAFAAAVFWIWGARTGARSLLGLDQATLGLVLSVAFVNSLTALVLTALQAQKRPRPYLWASMASAAVEIPLAAWALCSRHVSVHVLLGIEVAKQMATLAVCAYHSRAYVGLVWSGVPVRALLKFGVWVMPAALFEWLTFSTDRFLLGQLAGMDMVGVYGFYYKFITPLGLLFAGYIMTLDAQYFGMEGRGGTAYMAGSIRRFVRGAGLVIGLLCLALPAGFFLLIRTWSAFPRDYAAGVHIVPLLLSGAYLYWLSNHYSSILDFQLKTRQRFLVLLAAVAFNITVTYGALSASVARGWDGLLLVSACTNATFALLLTVQVRLSGQPMGRTNRLRVGAVVLAALAGSALWKWLAA